MSEIYFMGFEARKAIRPVFDRRKIRTPDLRAASRADGHKPKRAQTQAGTNASWHERASERVRAMAGCSHRAAKRINPKSSNHRRMKIQRQAKLNQASSVRKDG
jgi:hypothetical protein